jgi:hypothetical protein
MPVLFTGTDTAEFTGLRVPTTRLRGDVDTTGLKLS